MSVWKPHAGPQTALITCPCREVLYGGARGGGKTDGVLGEWLEHHHTHGEYANGLMIRRTLTELQETIERSKQIYGPIGSNYNDQKKTWTMPNGARLTFSYLERDSDADHFMGSSRSRLYVEEMGNFPSPAPINKLRSTLRSGHGIPVGLRATCNPGGAGHNWIKARYIDPWPAGWKVHVENFKGLADEDIQWDRVYIPAKVRDNPSLGAEYVANIQMSGSQALVKAWLDGDWNVIEGAFFDTWDTKRHIIRPFAIPKDWLRFRSADWGYATPFAIQWWAVVQDDHMVEGLDGGVRCLPRGCLVLYREWYGSPDHSNTGVRLEAEMVARGIKEREQGEKIAYGVMDPSAFNRTGSGPTIGERMANEGVIFRRGDNTRIGPRGALSGWDAMRHRLRGTEDGYPLMVVFATAVDFIRTVPVLQHHRDRPEDLETDGVEDHAADAGRYASLSRPWFSRDEEKVAAVPLAIEVMPNGQVKMNKSVREVILEKIARKSLH